MRSRRANGAPADIAHPAIAVADNVRSFRRISPDDNARLARFENDLRTALVRNPYLLDEATSLVHVIARGSAGTPECVVEIVSIDDWRLVGHAFHDAGKGISYALIVLVYWPAPSGGASERIAQYRHQAMTKYRFAPVYAVGEWDTYVEAPNAAAAIQLLACMIERLNPSVAVPDEDDPTESYVDVRAVSVYWDPASLMEEDA